MMDSRSLDFLQKKNIKDTNHLPKRVTREMIDYHDLVLAMDIAVLHFLNDLSPNNKSKYKIFNFLALIQSQLLTHSNFLSMNTT